MSLRDKVLQVSNIASLFCVVDCTILPVAMLLFPILGLGDVFSEHDLHELGHSVALKFVLPVGAIAATMNFLNHGNKMIYSLAGAGLLLVFLANGPEDSPLHSLLPGELACDLHCGTILHKATNLAGCACLMSGNIIGRKMGGEADCCTKEDGCGKVKQQ